MILEGFRNFGGGFEPPTPPSIRHCVHARCVTVDIVCFVYMIVVQKKEKLQSKFI
jgi:hypothetical protein